MIAKWNKIEYNSMDYTCLYHRLRMNLMFNYVNYRDLYGRVMQFNQNKQEPVHRWYPFVEGYSKEFINSIIDELKESPKICLEPFSGSGTTALELQERDILCHSFEVNPFMYLLASVKLENTYDDNKVVEMLGSIQKERECNQAELPETVFKTLYESRNNKKWNFNHEVAVAVQGMKQAILQIDEKKYQDLFKVALASILLDVSNLYRNGKCLSYKSDWEKRTISRGEVFDTFDRKVIDCFIPDIVARKNKQYRIKNRGFLHLEDARIGIGDQVEDDSVDLVITSPPYLNSRDYTDTYMLELKMLDFTPSFSSITDLRKKTIRSHVQIHWNDSDKETEPILIETLESLKIASQDSEIWNNSIFDMVNLYFVDMRRIFNALYPKMKRGGRIFFNVSNSAYFGVMIRTLDICAAIAQNEGFYIEEIREARMLKTSPQQKDQIGSLLEGVIVMSKR